MNILKSIKTAKTGVPNLDRLKDEWSKTQKYRGNLQQKKHTQKDVKKLLNRREQKLANDSNSTSRLQERLANGSGSKSRL